MSLRNNEQVGGWVKKIVESGCILTVSAEKKPGYAVPTFEYTIKAVCEDGFEVEENAWSLVSAMMLVSADLRKHFKDVFERR